MLVYSITAPSAGNQPMLRFAIIEGQKLKCGWRPSNITANARLLARMK